jgi:superoxide reductase
MTEQLQVFKCPICGIVAEALDGGAGEPVCCGRRMTLMEAKTAEAATEKHVPIVTQVDDGVVVRVGSVPHPMETQHFIQWIQVLADGKSYRQFLQPGDAPEAHFPVQGDGIVAREFCNQHGLWTG